MHAQHAWIQTNNRLEPFQIFLCAAADPPAQTMKSSTAHSTPPSDGSATVNSAGVHIFKLKDDQENLAPKLALKLAELSSNTEMNSYGVEQWEYLLRAGEVTALTVQEHDNGRRVLGCVLQVQYGRDVNAYGMMLVSPQARGQGLARRLLTSAMQLGQTSDDDDDDEFKTPKWHILGTCSEMGRPFYEKVGYKRVATVTRMTASFRRLQLPLLTTTDSENKLMVQIESEPANLDKLLELDYKATGIDRSKTLRSLASYPYVCAVTATDRASGKVVLAALVTRYSNSSSITIGPILGEEQHVPGLLRAVADHYLDQEGTDMVTVDEMALIISEHASLVGTLRDCGFETAFELGAMTLNGRDLPGRRELYLGLIHPTLG